MSKQEKIVYTMCPGSGCHENCVLETHVVDGKITRTERAILPGVEGDAFGICQKGIIAAELPYSSDRILYPQKRVGARGEGKFERISWKQAMDEIGAKLMEIKEKYGPKSVLVNNYSCGYPPVFNSINSFLLLRFVHTFDATLLPWVTCDTSTCFSGQIDFGSTFGFSFGNYDIRKLRESDYIIIWGSNPLGWTRATHTTYNMIEAQEKGAKIVTIGVVYDSTAAKSDLFIPINPGTDTILALAMANVIINEGLYDKDFLNKRTVAPFLVREDNGLFMHEKDIVPGGNPQNYLYWNRVPASAKSIAPHKFDLEGGSPDLFAEVTVNGVRCKTAFSLIVESISEWTPEKAETITGVPSQLIRELAHEYATRENAVIYENWGLRYYNSGPAARAITLVATLVGHMDKGAGGYAFGGALLGDTYPVSLNAMDITFPDGVEKAKGDSPLIMYEILEAGFPYKALLNVMSNPVHVWPNRKKWTDDIFPKLDLIVAYEIRKSDTALWADYILPDCTIFERTELLCSLANHIILNEPAIEPLGEAKPPAYFWKELGKRVGLEKYFDRDTEDWIKELIASSDPAIANVKPTITLERLKKEKMIRLNVPEDIVAWRNMNFLTPSGRIEIYSDLLAPVGHAIAKPTEAIVHGEERQTYPLQLFVGRHRVFMQSQFIEYSDLRQIGGDKPSIRLNSVDATNRGITDGDLVEVYNSRGSLRTIARISESIPPGMAHMWFGYRASEWEGDPPTKLMTPMDTKEVHDELMQRWIEIERKRAPGPLTTDPDRHSIRGWETLWDNLCEVRKVDGGK